MLSILIPTFNYNVTDLVFELNKQCIEQNISYEIIVMEDGSAKFLNENSLACYNTQSLHIVLPKNIGRSKIRNKLAFQAQYSSLLFLDCDATIPSSYFIQRYLSFIPCKNSVIMGGRIYNRENKKDNCSLVRTYGIQSEQNDPNNIKLRKKYPVMTTPNFLIDKEFFIETLFDETIEGYGHEDTILGIRLKRKNANFIYIDNPVIHVGLDINSVYLYKTDHSLQNMLNIYTSNKYPEFCTISKLLSAFIKMHHFRLLGLIKLTFSILSPLIRKNLLSNQPDMRIFSFYKLGRLCEIHSQMTK